MKQNYYENYNSSEDDDDSYDNVDVDDVSYSENDSDNDSVSEYSEGHEYFTAQNELEGGAYSLYPNDFPLEEMGMGVGGVMRGGFGPNKFTSFLVEVNKERSEKGLKKYTTKDPKFRKLYKEHLETINKHIEKLENELKLTDEKKVVKKKVAKKAVAKKPVAKKSVAKKPVEKMSHEKCMQLGEYYNTKSKRCNKTKPSNKYLLPITLKEHYLDKKIMCEKKGKVFNKKTKRCNKKVEDIIKKAANDVMKEVLSVKKKTIKKK